MPEVVDAGRRKWLMPDAGPGRRFPCTDESRGLSS